MHAALTSDVWRRSANWDRDEGCEGWGASALQELQVVAKSSDLSGCDAEAHASNAGSPDHLYPKTSKTGQIPGDCMIVEVTLHYRPQPFPELRHGQMFASGGPPVVDLSVAPLARLALGVGHRQARVKFRLASRRAARRFRGAHARRMRITMARVAAVDNGLRPISTGIKPQSAPSEWSATLT
jgi:hypothetical protein